MNKKRIGIIICCITVIIVLGIVLVCVLSEKADNSDNNTANNTELDSTNSTEADSTENYQYLIVDSPDITLPESEQFSWYKKPFLKVADMRAIKNGLYRGNIYSYKPESYGYNPTEYVAYYVGDKCGLVNSYGEIFCDAIYTDPSYCPEGDVIAFDDHYKAFDLETKTFVDHGGHGGGVESYFYDVNTDEFICITGMEGENEAIDYDKTGVYVVQEAYMEISNVYDDYVAYYYTETGKVGLYNNGKLVIPFEYTAASEVAEGVVGMYDGSIWTYFTVDGKMIMDSVDSNSDSFVFYEKNANSEYEERTLPCVFSYSCGCVPVKKDSKWGYMDKNGEMIIDAVFDYALPAFENRAWVCIDYYWGIIEIKK